MTSQSIAVGDNWVKVGNDYVGSSPNGAASGGTAALGWSGTLADGETLTITTDGTNPFGAGPTNVRFENFDGLGLTAGDDITSLNSEFDEHNVYYEALATADARSPGFAMSGIDESVQYPATRTLLFGAPATEVYISYATKIPTGKYFPGTTGAGNSGTDADYPSDSSWKIVWLLDNASDANDLCIPSHIGSNGLWSLSGNGAGIKLDSNDLGGKAPSWFGHNSWTRISSHIKAGATPNVDLGEAYFSATNGSLPIFEVKKDVVIFEGANVQAPYQFQKLNITGWCRSKSGGSDGLGADVQFLFDDIYLATGANAAARIEIGNAATYSACTDLAICKPESWANGEITATIKAGAFALTEQLWLHITLADNTTRYSVQVNL